MDNLRQVPQTGVANKRAANYDEVCKILLNEVIRCRQAVNRLTGTVEYPKPTPGCEKSPETEIVTVEDVICKTIKDLHECSNDLIALTERLGERVGELKILP